MTYEAFIKTLSSLDLTWSEEDEMIRSYNKKIDNWICPICAVANHLIGFFHYDLDFSSANNEIGLDIDLAHTIAEIADNDCIEYYSDYLESHLVSDAKQQIQIRKDLMKACKIPVH